MKDGSPLQIAIHDGEKDLKEKIHGIDKHREEVQPCFTGHHSCFEGWRADCSRGMWDMGKQKTTRKDQFYSDSRMFLTVGL